MNECSTLDFQTRLNVSFDYNQCTFVACTCQMRLKKCTQFIKVGQRPCGAYKHVRKLVDTFHRLAGSTEDNESIGLLLADFLHHCDIRDHSSGTLCYRFRRI